MTDMSGPEVQGSGAQDGSDERRAQPAFSPELLDEVRREMQEEEQARRKRLFGDREPFPIPEEPSDV